MYNKGDRPQIVGKKKNIGIITEKSEKVLQS